jgi:hypothetical protein
LLSFGYLTPDDHLKEKSKNIKDSVAMPATASELGIKYTTIIPAVPRINVISAIV